MSNRIYGDKLVKASIRWPAQAVGLGVSLLPNNYTEGGVRRRRTDPVFKIWEDNQIGAHSKSEKISTADVGRRLVEAVPSLHMESCRSKIAPALPATIQISTKVRRS
jgi:hypothetical protein